MPTGDPLPPADLSRVPEPGVTPAPVEPQATAIPTATPEGFLGTNATAAPASGEAPQADPGSQDRHEESSLSDEPRKPSSEAAFDMFEAENRKLQEAAETPTTLDQFRSQYETVQPVLYAASKTNVLGYVENTKRDVIERGQTYIAGDAQRILTAARRSERQIEFLLEVNGTEVREIGNEKQRLFTSKGSKGISISGELARMARSDFSTVGRDTRNDLRDSLEEAELHATALSEVSSELRDKTLLKMRKDIMGLDLDDFHKAAYLAAVDQGTDPLDLEGVAEQFADRLKSKAEAMKVDPDAPVLIQYVAGNKTHSILLEKVGEGLKFNFDPDSGEYGASVNGSAATYEPDAGPYASMYPQDRLVKKTGSINIPLGDALNWETLNKFADKHGDFSLVPILLGSDSIIAEVRANLKYQAGVYKRRGKEGNFESYVVSEAALLGITGKVFAGPEGEKLLADISEYNARPNIPPNPWG